MRATVNCLERRLGVYVTRAQAEAIAERWRSLGHRDVRIVDEEPPRTACISGGPDDDHDDPDDWRDHAIDAYERAKESR